MSSVARTPMAFEEAGWDKPEHRYTYDQVKAMERAEFDHRLDLHSIYGNERMFNTSYIRAKYPDPAHPVRRMLEEAHDNIHTDDQEFKSRWKLRREHVRNGLSRPDVHMGDTFRRPEHAQWAQQYGDAPRGPGRAGLLDPEGGTGDQVYVYFQQRQYDRLLRHGRRRQAEASNFMRQYEEREAMRHAYGSAGMSADLLTGESGMQAPSGQVGRGVEQRGAGVSRKPPVRMAQIFAPGTEGAMFTQRAMKQRQREKAHRGASAEQQILANTGVLPPPPGYHYMSTGELMRDPE